MAEETKPVEMTPPPASTWDILMSQCHGGIPLGELAVMIARPGTGKSRLTEYVRDKIVAGTRTSVMFIHGESDAQLMLALQFAFRDQYDNPNTCKGWEVIPSKGLVLYQYYSDSFKNVHQFPAPMSADDVFPIVKKWLASEDASKIPHEGWDVNMSHDGCNIVGWRMYLEDWGHVGGNWGALCCIKPAYLWLGK